MNIRSLQREAHAIAREKGWYDQNWTFGDFIALVHSELSKALEEYRRGCRVICGTQPPEGEPQPPNVPLDRTFDLLFDHDKPVGVAAKLAGVVIRAADTVEHYGHDLSKLLPLQWIPLRPPEDFGDWIAQAHWQASDALCVAYLYETMPSVIYALFEAMHRTMYGIWSAGEAGEAAA